MRREIPSDKMDIKFKIKSIFRGINDNSQNLRFNRNLYFGLKEKVSDINPKQPENHLKNPKEKVSPSKISKRGGITQVLYVKGIKPDLISINQLCNLFSNYGNIEIGVMHKVREFALIKYTTPEGAVLGQKYLHKQGFFGSLLNISFSHFTDLEEKWFSNQKNYYFPDKKCKRFRHDVPACCNSVSRTLHLSNFFNEKRRFVHENEILELITPIAQPVRVQRDSNKDHANMWFMEFRSKEDALLVLMKCHDLRFDDGNIRISFTKTKRSAHEPADRN